MATFISVTTSPFEEVREAARTRQQYWGVRRPVRGIQLKEETFAVIRVLTATNEEVQLLDSGSSTYGDDEIGRSGVLSNFLLQSVQEQRAEKQQIVETFGEDYIFFFGERPRFIRFSGLLLNTADFNWKSEFWENYDRNLRGTRLVELNARLYIYYDDVVVEGYIIDAGTNLETGKPYAVDFQFTLFVTNYAHLSNVGSIRFQVDEAFTLEEAEGITPAAADPLVKQSLPSADGGLNAFLASQAQYRQTASFNIHNTLENIRNTFFGRQLVVPEGLGSGLVIDPVTNNAKFAAAPTGQPIHTMNDEYVVRPDSEAKYDEEELKRVRDQLRLRTPEELEKKARAQLEALGIDVTRRETNYLLLGRGAFAATQYMASFGIRQADGALNLAGQFPSVL